MNHKTLSNAQFTPFQIHQIKLPVKTRDSPTFSILKTPTAIFKKTRSSTTKTKKLTFANGPVDLQSLRNGSHDSDASFDSGVDTGTDKKSNSNGDVSFEGVVEVAISPVKTMEVSPETWKAFLEYKKYSDYPNETEKTDYTYSRLSKFRHKEIIPGFLIRPNLSRSSISSRRTSLSYPSSQTSFNESYQSGSYDFKVYNQPRTEVIYDYSIPSQTSKFVRSKYYLRSSNFNSKDEGEGDSKSDYFENEYYSQFPAEEEKFVKKTTYMTTEPHEPSSSPYYTKLRSLNLDDADIDEVDVDADEHRSYGVRSGSRGEVWSVRNHETTTLKNFFTTVFLYVTSIGTLTKDLFSKYVLRREDGLSGSPYQDFGWKKGGSMYMSDSWIPWEGKTRYSATGYYSGGYYARPLNWYQRAFYYIQDKFSQMKNSFWGSRAGYSSYRYDDSSSKRRFWLFFIPLLLLGGSFLGYIDFFSNPKAILSTIYSWLFVLPSFIYYTFAVFIPRLITHFIPFLVFTWVPNFITVTIPYFVTTIVPYYFWCVVHFLGGLTLSGVWNAIVGGFNFALSYAAIAGMALYSSLIDLISAAYLLSSKYLILFYTNFCMQSYYLSLYLSKFVFYFFDFIIDSFNYLLKLFK